MFPLRLIFLEITLSLSLSPSRVRTLGEDLLFVFIANISECVGVYPACALASERGDSS